MKTLCSSVVTHVASLVVTPESMMVRTNQQDEWIESRNPHGQGEDYVVLTVAVVAAIVPLSGETCTVRCSWGLQKMSLTKITAAVTVAAQLLRVMDRDLALLWNRES
jgi:hypothetical protein